MEYGIQVLGPQYARKIQSSFRSLRTHRKSSQSCAMSIICIFLLMPSKSYDFAH
jgi:hypothetical protein